MSEGGKEEDEKTYKSHLQLRELMQLETSQCKNQLAKPGKPVSEVEERVFRNYGYLCEIGITEKHCVKYHKDIQIYGSPRLDEAVWDKYVQDQDT